MLTFLGFVLAVCVNSVLVVLQYVTKMLRAICLLVNTKLALSVLLLTQYSLASVNAQVIFLGQNVNSKTFLFNSCSGNLRINIGPGGRNRTAIFGFGDRGNTIIRHRTSGLSFCYAGHSHS